MPAAIETIQPGVSQSAITFRTESKPKKRTIHKANRRISILLLQLVVPAIILLVWVLITEKEWIKPYFVPRLEKIFVRSIEMVRFENLLNDFWLSFHVMLIENRLHNTWRFHPCLSQCLSGNPGCKQGIHRSCPRL